MCLLVIWAFVGYSIVNRFLDVAPINSVSEFTSSKKLNPVDSKDSFVLNNLNRDPFLDSYITTEVETSSPMDSKTTYANPPAATTWPNIKYYGFVKNETSKIPLILLKIDNKMKRLRRGTTSENLTVDAIYKDSVVISHGKQTRTFPRQ